MMSVLILTHWVPLGAFLQAHLQNAILRRGSAKIRVCKSFGMDTCHAEKSHKSLSQRQLRLFTTMGLHGCHLMIDKVVGMVVIDLIIRRLLAVLENDFSQPDKPTVGRA